MATSRGMLYTADWRGGVYAINPHGQQHLYQAEDIDFEIRPNGIALMPNGDFLIAHLGETRGGLFQLTRKGHCTPLLTELNGCPLEPSNYPHLDHQGRIWLTISTRQMPRSQGYRSDVSDGFIVLIDSEGSRIVADDIGYTNECCVHPSGDKLYVNETFSRRLSSYDIATNGDLSNKRTIAEFGHGTYPDGLTFDQAGGIWITSIISNRVIRVSPDGEQSVILEDANPEKLEWIEQAFLSGSLGRIHLDNSIGTQLGNISSLAFGGDDMKTVYLGCLLHDHVVTFRSPIPGWKPTHWQYSMGV